MNTSQELSRTKWRIGSAVCLVAAIAFVVLAGQPASLSATQDESTNGEQQVMPLRVPEDMTEETIERADMTLAGAVGSQLRSLFSEDTPDAARLAAADEILVQVAPADGDSAALAAVKNRIVRRVTLVRQFLLAAQVTDPTTSESAADSGLSGVTSETVAWLNQVREGDKWISFLNLQELQQPGVTREQIAVVSGKFATADSWNDAQKSFLEKPQLQKLRSAVESAIAAYDPPGDETVRADLRKALRNLLVQILAAETDRLGIHSELARTGYGDIRSRFPGAADVIRPVMLDQFLNYNVHFSISEDLLSRLVSDYRTETGCIADCILGAWVTGSQVTTVNVRADVRPSADRANFQLVVSGNTRSNTTGRREPATVFTRGDHYFTISKPVWFDGDRVTHDPATISVDPNNTTLGVRTDYDRIPLIGSLVRSIARQRVAESRGQSEAIAARKLSDQALPEFETEAARQLADMDTEVHDKILQGLRDHQIAPDTVSARSSNTHIAVSSRTLGARLGGSRQPELPLSVTGMTIQVHESALNNSTDALGLNGRTINENDVQGEIEKALSEILHREISLTKDAEENAEPTEEPADPAEPPSTFVFSATDPVRVMFGDGEVTLVLRTGVLQEGKEDIPEQIIRIPFVITMEGGQLILEPGTIGVSSVDEVDRLKQVTRATQIRRILGRRFKRQELDPTLELTNASDETVEVTLQSITFADGWLNAELQ